ncbi:MAG: hypothetical protein LBS21_11490 [Clostridiales bacterium]|nr:hypothetical protein [Clostridiales bacterium]
MAKSKSESKDKPKEEKPVSVQLSITKENNTKRLVKVKRMPTKKPL